MGISLSAREAFHLNANPHALIAGYEPEEWGNVLREIERHQPESQAQRTPEQVEWLERRRGAPRSASAPR